MNHRMKNKSLEKNIEYLNKSRSGVEFDIFSKFFLSEKSIKKQQEDIISFFVHKGCTKTIVRNAINKISQEDNCHYVHSLNVKPKRKASRYKRNRYVSKVHGDSAENSKLKMYVRLKNPRAFFGNMTILRGNNE